jgi:hypothetical protein
LSRAVAAHLLTIDGEILLDPDHEFGTGATYLLARRGPEHRGVGSAGASFPVTDRKMLARSHQARRLVTNLRMFDYFSFGITHRAHRDSIRLSPAGAGDYLHTERSGPSSQSIRLSADASRGSSLPLVVRPVQGTGETP